MTDADAPMPTGKFEWERLILRVPMPELHQRLALILGVFADGDGTRVRPGNKILAAVTRKSERTVIRTQNDLRDWQLITQVSRGGGKGGEGKTTEYRLSCPTDLLDRFELLPPDLHPAPKSGDTKASPQSAKPAVDNHGAAVDREINAVDNPGDATTNEVTNQPPRTRMR